MDIIDIIKYNSKVLSSRLVRCPSSAKRTGARKKNSHQRESRRLRPRSQLKLKLRKNKIQMRDTGVSGALFSTISSVAFIVFY